MHLLPHVAWLAGLLPAAALLAWALTGLVVRVFTGAHHSAAPNERTMHTQPTPNVGGLALVATVLVLGALAVRPTTAALTLGGSVALLALVSWIDHYRPLWPLTRFLIQGLTVATALLFLPADLRMQADLPLWLERAVLGLGWMWIVNLTNFIDGIDGVAATGGALTALGYVAVVVSPLAGGAIVPSPLPASVSVALLLAGACLGYLVWNWHPARIFMGDSGSIPLGFLIGFLLLDLGARGLWVSALILHAPYLADATLTLLKRLLRGEKIWRAHRSHFYQRAVQGGYAPAVVVRRIALAHVILVVLAVVARDHPLPALFAATGVVVLLLAHLSELAMGAPRFIAKPAAPKPKRT